MSSTLKMLPLLLAAAPALAQPARPEAAPLPPPIPAPQDRPYPGTITLAVDATDTDRHIFRIHETVPTGGAQQLTFMYPKWIPGNHGPTGPISELAGLVVKAGGQRIEWQRDPVDMYAFHINVPQRAGSVDLYFECLSPPEQKQGRVVMTPNLLDVQWTSELLYPAGFDSRDIVMQPSLTLPDGWKFGSALEPQAEDGPHVTFKPVKLVVLMDSPLYAGRYFSRIDLAPGANVPVHLNVVADRPEDLAIKDSDLAAHRTLVTQALRTFGSHHYDHYDFLLSLSDEMGGEGLEHHRSSEDSVGRLYFTDLEKSAADRDLLPHEYTHSWNGKFRRPADLFSPDFNVVPERDSLLWVYEGQTEYWGQVLAARSGLLTAANVRDNVALFAAMMQATVGRSWRPLQDTTNNPIFNLRHPLAWEEWQRDEDYYLEGLLMWLDADTLIREKTDGAKSLNDFARSFFGIEDGDWGVATYEFNDVVKALNDVVPYDWARFLRARLDGHGPGAPLDGLKRGGWRLAYTAEPSAMEKAFDGTRKMTSFAYSLGLRVDGDGGIDGVLWDSPAFRAGLAAGTKLIAVNGLAYDDADQLGKAIALAKGTAAPIELLVRDGQHFRTVKIGYHDGLRYPHLERIPNTPDRLDDILAPVK